MRGNKRGSTMGNIFEKYYHEEDQDQSKGNSRGDITDGDERFDTRVFIRNSVSEL